MKKTTASLIILSALTFAQTPPPQAAPAAALPNPDDMPGPLSPLVRKMARENIIDLSKVKGTGAGSRCP